MKGPIGVDEFGSDDPDLVESVEGIEEFVQPMIGDFGVAVEEDYELAPRIESCSVAATKKAKVFVVADESNPFDLIEFVRVSCVGVVVDDDDFVARSIRGAFDGSQASKQVANVIVDGNDYGYQRVHRGRGGLLGASFFEESPKGS